MSPTKSGKKPVISHAPPPPLLSRIWEKIRYVLSNRPILIRTAAVIIPLALAGSYYCKTRTKSKNLLKLFHWQMNPPSSTQPKSLCAFCIPQFPFEFWVRTAEWQFGRTQVIRITIWLFTHKNINIYYFEISGQIAIRPFSIKMCEHFCTQVIRPFTPKFKRNLRHSKDTIFFILINFL